MSPVKVTIGDACSYMAGSLTKERPGELLRCTPKVSHTGLGRHWDIGRGAPRLGAGNIQYRQYTRSELAFYSSPSIL